jgi:hypothetical protein
MGWIQVNSYSQDTMRSGCLICGNGDVRRTVNGPEPILSSGYQDEWSGTPEICATCIGEAATMLGWISGPTHAKEVEARKAAQAEATNLQSQVDDKVATIRTLTSELAALIVAKDKVIATPKSKVIA